MMSATGMRPSPAAFTSLIEACAEASRLDHAFDVMQCVVARYLWIIPWLT